jgi:hypothetical protein
MGIFQRRCSEKSQIWKEKHCHFENSDESKCNSTCVNLEHAMFGTCQFSQDPGFVATCYCTFNCTEYIPRLVKLIETEC